MTLKEYTTTDLANCFNAEEICFAVKEDPDWIDELSTVTDDFEEAKEIAKEKGYQIYIYKKKFARDCFDADWLFDSLTDNLEFEGYDFDYSETDKKEFDRITEQWFNKIVGETWFAYDLLGVLKDD